jgi:hypothetical protein
MHHLKVIVELPEAVVREVLVCWLQLEDVVYLDTAFCVKELRSQYLNTAYAKSATFHLKSDERYNRGIPWCLLRGVQLDGVCLRGSLETGSEFRQMFATRCGKNLRWVQFQETYEHRDVYQLLFEMVKSCQNVQHVALRARSNIGMWVEVLNLFLESCHQIQSLFLEFSRLPADSLVTLHDLSLLVELKLVCCGCIALPEEVAIPSLRELDVRNCAINDAVLVAIGANCAQLRELYIFRRMWERSSKPFTDVGVRAVLQGCPLLQTTDVESAEGISHEVRVELVRRRNFTTLYLSEWLDYDDDLAQKIMQACPRLTELHCMEETLSNATLAMCGLHCPLLETINLCNCGDISAEGAQALFRPGSKLRTIVLTRCMQLRDESLLAIASNCPRLEVCYFAGIGLGNDAAVVKLAEGCSLLREVTFDELRFGDSGVTALAVHCTKLEALHLPKCPLVTMQGVRALAEHARTLQRLALPRNFADKDLSQMFGYNTVVRV